MAVKGSVVGEGRVDSFVSQVSDIIGDFADPDFTSNMSSSRFELVEETMAMMRVGMGGVDELRGKYSDILVPGPRLMSSEVYQVMKCTATE